MSSSTIHRTRSGFAQRAAFTLTELLIGITIIGLLVGMLAVAGAGVIGTTREFAVTSEITQMGLAIESFKTEYGFYPPSFEQFKRTVNTGDSAPYNVVHAESSQLLPFLNKIAPNNQEAAFGSSPIPSRASAGYSILDDWWEFVGCNLDQSTSLQFWLAGLSQNKQFPLTGGLTPAISGDADLYLPAAYNVSVFINGADIPDAAAFDRKVFYDFDKDRMIPVSIFDGGAETRPIVQYIMDHGKTNGDLFYVYRDSGSYQPVAQPDPSHLDPNSRMATTAPAIPASDFASIDAYLASPNHRGPAYYSVDATGTPEFANPNTFQIISFGLDGDPGVSPTATADRTRGLLFDKSAGVQEVQLPQSSDNLCNFAQGRLDKYITEQQ
jgi:prepilin-type N-terminal cleavage/methylation domain-containing protein